MILYRKIFGRQTEGVPTHRIKDIIALKSLFAADNVYRRIGTGMSHMKSLTRGIRELYKSVKLRKRIIVLCGKGLLFVPYILPLFFNLRVIVIFCHC